MRLAIATWPNWSHRVPLLDIADHAIDRGHEVLFATAAGECLDAAATIGCDVFAGPAECKTSALEVAPDGTTLHETRPYVVTRMDREFLAEARRWRPDAILADDWESSAAGAALALGVPLLSSFAGCTRPDLATRADAAVAPFPPSLLAPDMLAVPRLLSYRLSPAPVDDAVPELDDWPDDLRDLPLVAASLGTCYDGWPASWQAIVAALSLLPVRAVLHVFGDGVVPTLLPPQIRVVRGYLPHERLFRDCAAAVTHGASQTTSKAIGAGVPVVIATPNGAEAARTATAVRTAGAGVALLLRDAVADPSLLADAVEEVLANPAYAAACATIAAEIAYLPPVDAVVDRIERLARPPAAVRVRTTRRPRMSNHRLRILAATNAEPDRVATIAALARAARMAGADTRCATGNADDLLDRLDGWTPDVVLCDAEDRAGHLVASSCDLPLAVVAASGSVPPVVPTADLVLCPMPPSWATDGLRELSSALFFRLPGGHDVAAGVDDHVLAATGVVIVVDATPGPGDRWWGDLWRAVLAGLADEPVTVALRCDEALFVDLGPLPRNAVRVVSSARESLFRRAGAVVARGSLVGVVAALAVGTPLVLLPTAAEELDNAGRAETTGTGTFTFANNVRANPERIGRLVHRVLDDVGYAAAARSIAEEIAALPGPEAAIQTLENAVSNPTGQERSGTPAALAPGRRSPNVYREPAAVAISGREAPTDAAGKEPGSHTAYRRS